MAPLPQECSRFTVNERLFSDLTNPLWCYVQEFTSDSVVCFPFVINVFSIRWHYLHISNRKSRPLRIESFQLRTRWIARAIPSVWFLSMWLQIRFMYDSLQSDYNTLRNPVELGILSKHAEISRRVFFMLLCKNPDHVHVFRCVKRTEMFRWTNRWISELGSVQAWKQGSFRFIATE